MKRKDIVWYFTASHHLRYGEILRKEGDKYIIKNKNQIVRRKISQIAIKERR